MNEQLLKQLGVDQQILQQMVDERAALAEAERLGHHASSDEEVRAAHPRRSRRSRRTARSSASSATSSCCSMQRPPMTPPSSRTASAARSSSTSCARRSPTGCRSPTRKLEQEYRRRNDKVKLAVVSVPADSFRPDVTATDAEVATYFDGAQGRLQDSREAEDPLPARRPRRACARRSIVPPADIERAYNDNIEQYSTPEQVRASHILLKTEGKDEATSRRRPKSC